MSVKYVKLNAEHTEWESALYSMKPRQIRRLTDAQARDQHWFPVKEFFEPLPDRQLYRSVRDTWAVVDGYVEVQYKSEMIYLQGRREIMASRIHELRNDKLRGGVTYNGDRFDTKPETMQRITGAVLSVMLDETFTTDWITEDNQSVTLNAQQIVELGKAFAAHESKMIMFARDLKDGVLSSDEPETFVINEGWPSTVYGIIVEDSEEPPVE